LVSVIIPCYNQAQYLPDALNSIFEQSYTNWECIIVNDGSPDNTEEVAHHWIEKDNRFLYLKKENGGLSSARNEGLRIAKGDYIQFLDADDIIHSEKFEIQISLLKNTDVFAISISSYFSSIENNLNIAHPTRYLTSQFKTQNFLNEIITDWEINLSIPVHCFLFKTAIFKRNSIFFCEDLPNHEDWECWMNLFRLNPEVKYTKQKLAVYRIRNCAMCSNELLMKKGFLQALSIQKEKFSRLSPEYKLLLRRYNFIKFGINSESRIQVYYRFAKKILPKIYRKLINNSYSSH